MNFSFLVTLSTYSWIWKCRFPTIRKLFTYESIFYIFSTYRNNTLKRTSSRDLVSSPFIWSLYQCRRILLWHWQVLVAGHTLVCTVHRWSRQLCRSFQPLRGIWQELQSSTSRKIAYFSVIFNNCASILCYLLLN